MNSLLLSVLLMRYEVTLPTAAILVNSKDLDYIILCFPGFLRVHVLFIFCLWMLVGVCPLYLTFSAEINFFTFLYPWHLCNWKRYLNDLFWLQLLKLWHFEKLLLFYHLCSCSLITQNTNFWVPATLPWLWLLSSRMLLWSLPFSNILTRALTLPCCSWILL